MNAQSKPGRSGPRGYAHLIEVQAPLGRVWRALTDPGLIRIWQGQEAEIDARMGGLYRIGSPKGKVREAHIDIFEPNRRLRLIYMPMRDMPHADSAMVDDFLLEAREKKTSVRLLGSGVPTGKEWDAFYVQLRIGWERLLARMKVMLEKPPPPKKSLVDPKDPPLAGFG
jgi:uncharacterized protein YndB with AHSA1/START domain